MKEFISTVIDTIKDDRFGIRFKICNIIMNDRLRLEIAYTLLATDNITRDCDTMFSLLDDSDYAVTEDSYKRHCQYVQKHSKRVRKELEEIWRL